MTPIALKKGALAALSVVLFGCASTPELKEAAIVPGARPEQTLRDGAPYESRPTVVPSNVEGAVKQAQAQRKSGDLVGATRTLSQLVLIAADDARVLGEYGKTLIAQGRSEDALAFLERAIELQSNDWSLFSALGVAFDQKADYQAAQRAYSRALALKPGDPTVLSNNALSHVLSGDLEKAEDLLMQASQDAAEFPRIASNLAFVRSLKSSRPQRPQAQAGNSDFAPAIAPREAEPATIISSVAVSPTEVSPVQAENAPTSAETPPVIMPEVRPNAALSALERLRVDPGVRLQPLPQADISAKSKVQRMKAGTVAEPTPKKPVTKEIATQTAPRAEEANQGLSLRPGL